jgi:hypothetical protein
MRYVLFVLVSACMLVAQQPKPGTGSIEGTVLDSLTGAPVRKAIVNLIGSQNQWLGDETDAKGRFHFTALPAGSYRLTGGHAGFLSHGARRPIVLGQDGHVTDAEIRLPRQGVIAGRVLDEDGDPVGGATVSLFKQTYRNGRQQWDRLNGGITNDTGEYRVADLVPGRYLVEAMNTRMVADNRYGEKPAMIYTPAYYPNAGSQQAASPMEVGVGADLRGIDIQISKSPVFHVRGKVTGVRPDSGIILTVRLIPAHGVATLGGGADAGPPDYLFDATVVPGQYTVVASPNFDPGAYAVGSVSVSGNVAGVSLTLSPAPEVTGRISVVESGAQVILKGVRVELGITFPGLGPGFRADVQSDAAGKFIFVKPIPPGPYNMVVSYIPEGCFVQKVKLGGREVDVRDFEIMTSTPVEIVLSNTAGKIAGLGPVTKQVSQLADERGRIL